ncbi:MAG: DUF354 domain-containing protein [bacterium]|nr:DUF354 domain-containing protein [bacterium]
MKLLIDIGHPAHVHLFRNFFLEMKKKNIAPIVTVKNIPAAEELLDLYGIEHITIGAKSDSIFGKLMAQFSFNWQLYKLVKKHKITLGIGTSITLTHVSKVTKMKSLLFDDDDAEVQPLFVKFAHPFADCLLSPDVLKHERTKKHHITYPGYHELAYLHPNRYTPDPGILEEAGLKEGDKYFVMRFNVFKAHHDVGVKGLSLEQKLKLVETLEKEGRVFITTEREIEPELKKYQLKIPSHKIHSFIHYATMLVGDSQTMTSEAAVLGTPAIRCNSLVGRIAYLEEEEHKYNLTYGFKPEKFDALLTKVQELLAMPDLKQEWQKRREILLKDKIDVTAFFVWFVENYPESVNIIEKDPEYTKKFH